MKLQAPSPEPPPDSGVVQAVRGRRLSALALGIVAMIFVASMWLREAFPLFALGDAGYDDQLFVQMAENVGAGNWLGSYSKMTLAKGAAYSMFMALNNLTGAPLKLAEHFVYLCCSLYFSLVLGSVLKSRTALAVCFAILAFDPLAWAPEVGGRVVREGLYTSLSLLLLAIALRAFVERRADRLREDLRLKRGLLIALGLAAAAFWLTREEGAWLVPSLSIPLVYWLVSTVRREGVRRESVARMLQFLALPLLAFALVVGAMNARNLSKYGTFRNNDFRSDDFPAAYGALSRISHEGWRRYVVFPRDARVKAYAASPAARELERSLEGEIGEFWRHAGCRQTATSPCPEILSGWFMWAMRDAVEAAGHYATAEEARRFYLRLAAEVNAACDRRALPCGPARSTMVPPWHDEYLAWTVSASRDVLKTLLSLGNMTVRVVPSTGPQDRLAQFARVTNGPVASAADERSDDARRRLATAIASGYKESLAYAVPAAIVAWAGLLAFSALRRRWHAGHAVAAVLGAAIAARVVLLGFLEATSIPSNYLLYLSPVVPITLAFPVCIAFLAWALAAPAATHAPR